MGLHHLWLFTAPAPCGGCACCGQGVGHADCALCEKCVFLSTHRGIHSSGSSMGNWLQQQQLLIVVFRGVWCTIGTGICHKFWRRIQHVIKTKTPENEDNDD